MSSFTESQNKQIDDLIKKYTEQLSVINDIMNINTFQVQEKELDNSKFQKVLQIPRLDFNTLVFAAEYARTLLRSIQSFRPSTYTFDESLAHWQQAFDRVKKFAANLFTCSSKYEDAWREYIRQKETYSSQPIIWPSIDEIYDFENWFPPNVPQTQKYQCNIENANDFSLENKASVAPNPTATAATTKPSATIRTPPPLVTKHEIIDIASSESEGEAEQGEKNAQKLPSGLKITPPSVLGKRTRETSNPFQLNEDMGASSSKMPNVGAGFSWRRDTTDLVDKYSKILAQHSEKYPEQKKQKEDSPNEQQQDAAETTKRKADEEIERLFEISEQQERELENLGLDYERHSSAIKLDNDDIGGVDLFYETNYVPRKPIVVPVTFTELDDAVEEIQSAKIVALASTKNIGNSRSYIYGDVNTFLKELDTTEKTVRALFAKNETPTVYYWGLAIPSKYNDVDEDDDADDDDYSDEKIGSEISIFGKVGPFSTLKEAKDHASFIQKQYGGGGGKNFGGSDENMAERTTLQLMAESFAVSSFNNGSWCDPMSRDVSNRVSDDKFMSFSGFVKSLVKVKHVSFENGHYFMVGIKWCLPLIDFIIKTNNDNDNPNTENIRVGKDKNLSNTTTGTCNPMDRLIFIRQNTPVLIDMINSQFAPVFAYNFVEPIDIYYGLCSNPSKQLNLETQTQTQTTLEKDNIRECIKDCWGVSVFTFGLPLVTQSSGSKIVYDNENVEDEGNDKDNEDEKGLAAAVIENTYNQFGKTLTMNEIEQFLDSLVVTALATLTPSEAARIQDADVHIVARPVLQNMSENNAVKNQAPTETKGNQGDLGINTVEYNIVLVPTDTNVSQKLSQLVYRALERGYGHPLNIDFIYNEFLPLNL